MATLSPRHTRWHCMHETMVPSVYVQAVYSASQITVYACHLESYLLLSGYQTSPALNSHIPLTLSRRDLNALCSGCLLAFFLGFFKFQCMLLEKKSYLVDFSFKFNAIKFGNLLMNWFIWKKMLTCCYNKFRPLNRMHHVKCSVNSSLLT